MTTVLAVALLVMAMVVLSSTVLLRRVDQRDRIAARLAFAQGISTERPTSRSPIRFVAKLGAAFAESGVLSSKTLAELERSLARSGFRSETGLSLFVGGKLLGMMLLPLPPWFLLQGRIGLMPHFALCAAAGIAGMLMPDLIVRRMRARYLSRVNEGLADALDMLVICAEAGLGLVTAVHRVAAEIARAHPQLASELATTADELHVISDPRVALSNMGGRTGLPALKRLGATLIQSQTYGTPLAQALRTLAAEMRQETLIRFEERAARLPALLTIPMIVFILPSIFLVVGGPAMIQVLRVVRH